MARKKSTESQDVEPQDEKLRAVRLEVSEEEHRLLRLEAARRDVSLSTLARELVAQGLKKAGGK